MPVVSIISDHVLGTMLSIPATNDIKNVISDKKQSNNLKVLTIRFGGNILAKVKKTIITMPMMIVIMMMSLSISNQFYGCIIIKN